jgi:hypothetical protein
MCSAETFVGNCKRTNNFVLFWIQAEKERLAKLEAERNKPKEIEKSAEVCTRNSLLIAGGHAIPQQKYVLLIFRMVTMRQRRKKMNKRAEGTDCVAHVR